MGHDATPSVKNGRPVAAGAGSRPHVKPMTPKTAFLAAALLAVAATAAAHPYLETRSPIAQPYTASLVGVGAGAALCQPNTLGIPLDCAVGGYGAAFFDASHLNAHGTSQVEGTCAAQKTLANVGDLEFICGSDRDDDAFISNVDPNGDDDSPGSDHGTNAAGYDDQYSASTVPSGTSSGSLAVCFTHDADGAGHDWDDLVVFVIGNVPNGYVGPTTVTLSLDDRATDC